MQVEEQVLSGAQAALDGAPPPLPDWLPPDAPAGSEPAAPAPPSGADGLQDDLPLRALAEALRDNLVVALYGSEQQADQALQVPLVLVTALCCPCQTALPAGKAHCTSAPLQALNSTDSSLPFCVGIQRAADPKTCKAGILHAIIS